MRGPSPRFVQFSGHGKEAHPEGTGEIQQRSGHPGAYGIRFCYFNLEGRFQRSPMMIDGDETFEGLRAALRETPRLREMLRKLVGDEL